MWLQSCMKSYTIQHCWQVLAFWPKFGISSSLFNMKMSYTLHYQSSSFFPYLYVCVHISVVLSHSCFSLHLTSVHTADFLSHFYKLPEVKWPVTHPALKAASAMFFFPFCSSPGQAHCPQPVSAFGARGLWFAPQFTATTHRADISSHWLVTTLLGGL